MPTRRLLKISVVKAAAVIGITYAILGLIAAPVFAVAMGVESGRFLMFLLLGLIGFPLFYGIIGFVVAAIAVGIFNVVAPRIGGVDVEFANG